MKPQSIIVCKNCGRVCSNLLVQVEENFEPQYLDCSNVIPKGRYWIAKGMWNQRVEGNIMIHLGDYIGLTAHPDASRHDGCCGPDGSTGVNLVCSCESEIATRVEDCWTSYYAHFQIDKVRIVIPNNR